MLYRKTKLFLGLIPIFISFLVSQSTVAKLNINPEPTRIELTTRLNRCKDQGFIVDKNPSNEKILRELVDTCESNLKIVYPPREDLLVRLENCVQSGYKDEIPNNLTLVDLNDLVDLCEKRFVNRSNSSSNYRRNTTAWFCGIKRTRDRSLACSRYSHSSTTCLPIHQFPTQRKVHTRDQS